jgi:hypothetical protein
MAEAESAAIIETGKQSNSTQLTIPRKADQPIPRSVINCFDYYERIVSSKVLGSQWILCLREKLTVENFSEGRRSA